tara:strand:+ start:170 stop:1315 length:1146 start_codon:yes stop_codon:yes gene_type:complete
MKKQKICVIGDGLTGLATALVLSKLDIEIDLIFKNKKVKKFKDNRTTAISESNYSFLSKHISHSDVKIFYSCKSIDLYHEKLGQHHHFMNFTNEGKYLIHIAENKKLKKIFLKNIQKQKNIKIINGEVTEINVEKSTVSIKNKNLHYDLIALCLGRRSNIVSQLVGKRFIEDDLKEISFTSLVKHNSNISEPKQYFLKEGPLAILPIKRNMFSFVWSMSKDYRKQNIESIKQLIHLKLKNILDSKTKIALDDPMAFPISFKFNVNFVKKNSLVLGDSSYNVHPIAGQGFNLILRDVKKLFEYIQEQQFLGLQIKDSTILEKFIRSRKPENLLFGLGIDFTNRFFKHHKNTSLFKEIILKDINRFKFLKKLGLKISDQGIFQ